MSYLLATTETCVRWYVVSLKGPDALASLKPGEFELVDQLNLDLVTGFDNKEAAKRVALALGLKTWRYVKLG